MTPQTHDPEMPWHLAPKPDPDNPDPEDEPDDPQEPDFPDEVWPDEDDPMPGEIPFDPPPEFRGWGPRP